VKALRLRPVFVAASVAWCAALPLGSAAAAAAGSAWSRALALVVYAAGASVCHQLSERSFFLWAVQMPVCARCTGVYVGAALAALAGCVRPMPVPAQRYARLMLVAASVPAILSLVYEWTSGDVPANWIRGMTGMLLGAAVGHLIVTAVAEIDQRSPERRERLAKLR
jgi:uncharacterized membrane protein